MTFLIIKMVLIFYSISALSHVDHSSFDNKEHNESVFDDQNETEEDTNLLPESDNTKPEEPTPDTSPFVGYPDEEQTVPLSPSQSKNWLNLDSEKVEPTTSAHRPDGHAPIGIMRDHVHKKGEFMISYRISWTRQKTNYETPTESNLNLDLYQNTLDQNKKAESKESTFMTHNMIPSNLGVMYGVTNNVTLTGMAGFKFDLRHFYSQDKLLGNSYRINLNNVAIFALYAPLKTLSYHFVLGLGASFIADTEITQNIFLYNKEGKLLEDPEKATTKNQNNNNVESDLSLTGELVDIKTLYIKERLSYTEQSTMYNISPIATFVYFFPDFSLGVQSELLYIVNFQKVVLNTSFWGAMKVSNSFSLSLRTAYDYGVFDLSFGFNYISSSKKHRLGFEICFFPETVSITNFTSIVPMLGWQYRF